MKRAAYGSRRDWITLSIKIPPQVEAALTKYETTLGTRRTDVVREALTILLTYHGFLPKGGA